MTAVFTRTNDNVVTLTLTGTATAHDDNDVSDLTITFTNDAFANQSVANVINPTYITGEIDFRGVSTLTYDGEFTESTADDGTVTGSITATLSGDTFAAEGVITNGTAVMATTTNFPAGLTAEFTRTSDTVVTLTLTGAANDHAHINDVNDLAITFTDAAFAQENAGTIMGLAYTSGVINFSEAFLTYDGSFTEDALNNGTVTGSITATLSGDIFHADVVARGYVAAGNPTGLTAEFTRTSDTVVTLTFTGTALQHATAVDNLTITFEAVAFETATVAAAVANSIYTTTIDFDEMSTLDYDKNTLPESATNDGSVTGSITATLTGDTFATDVVTSGYVSATVPNGLTAEFTRTNDTVVTLTLTGQADPHHSGITGTDAGGVRITFMDSAFTLENADTIARSTYDVEVTFRDVSIFAGSFTETDANDGTVTGSITATLTGDTFATDVVTSNYVSATTIPDGLIAVFTRTSDKVVTLTLTGTATAHSNSNEADLIIEFTADAFVSESAAPIVYTTTITFIDGALTFGAETIDDMRYKVGDVVNEILPEATGGALPLSYSLPSLTFFRG